MTITRALNRSARTVVRPEEAERIRVSRGELIYVCRS